MWGFQVLAHLVNSIKSHNCVEEQNYKSSHCIALNAFTTTSLRQFLLIHAENLPTVTSNRLSITSFRVTFLVYLRAVRSLAKNHGHILPFPATKTCSSFLCPENNIVIPNLPYQNLKCICTISSIILTGDTVP